MVDDNELLSNDLVSSNTSFEWSDYVLKDFDCPYKDKCDYNKKGKMIYKCLGTAEIEGDKNCILETTVNSKHLSKDSPLYREKGRIGFAFFPIRQMNDSNE